MLCYDIEDIIVKVTKIAQVQISLKSVHFDFKEFCAHSSWREGGCLAISLLQV
jgi:hypothetical protein